MRVAIAKTITLCDNEESASNIERAACNSGA